MSRSTACGTGARARAPPVAQARARLGGGWVAFIPESGMVSIVSAIEARLIAGHSRQRPARNSVTSMRRETAGGRVACASRTSEVAPDLGGNGLSLNIVKNRLHPATTVAPAARG
jgi:hypothetical protein